MANLRIVSSPTQNVQEHYFRITDQIPAEVWYWSSLGSIIASIILFASDKHDWSNFVGQWAPTFLLFGLFHRLPRSSR